jgi:sn-glycerol 3-phosphate transport system ATP-binding protein
VDLYETPANVFVARFIGTPPMNLLPLSPGAGGAVIAGTSGPVLAPVEHSLATLGVRPEHVALGREAGVDAKVEAVEYLGADSLVTCRAGAHAIAARVAGRTGLASGDRTRASWARGAQHFFDAASGARLDIEPSHRGATMVA